MTFFFRHITGKRKYLKSAPPTHHQNSPKSLGEDDEQKQQQQQQLVEIYPPTILDLPPHIVIEIISTLPLKEILILRCVCKTLRILISDPEFARLHFRRANVELFLRINHLNCISRTLHWVDSETIPIKDDGFCGVRRDTEINVQFHLPRDYPKYNIVNACNGFLCLCELSFSSHCILCNPITGEYFNVPKPEEDNIAVSAFGYSLGSNQYKLLRLVFHNSLSSRLAEIYTLGTSSWRKIDYGPQGVTLFATYLNGAIHWICEDIDDDHESDFILGFDFDDESFFVLPPPSQFGGKQKKMDNLYTMNMGVLGGCLSLCDSTGHLDIWVMQDYGVQESWIKQFSIENCSPTLYQPIKYLDNGDVLMLFQSRAFELYNPTEQVSRCVPIHEAQSIGFEAVTYTPSFFSLKDAVGGDDLEVQNVRSRYVESELQEEAETLFLVESNNPWVLLSLLGVPMITIEENYDNIFGAE